jgi:hypothetical protein
MPLYPAKPWRTAWGTSGSATITANSSTTSGTTILDITGLSVSWTAVTGRRYKVSVSGLLSATLGDRGLGFIRDGASTTLTRWAQHEFTATGTTTIAQSGFVLLSGLSGAQTSKVSIQREAGTGSVLISGSTIFPASILVEDIGPA